MSVSSEGGAEENERERRVEARTGEEDTLSYKRGASLSCVPVSHPRSSAISGRRLSPDKVTSTVPRVRTKW